MLFILSLEGIKHNDILRQRGTKYMTPPLLNKQFIQKNCFMLTPLPQFQCWRTAWCHSLQKHTNIVSGEGGFDRKMMYMCINSFLYEMAQNVMGVSLIFVPRCLKSYLQKTLQNNRQSYFTQFISIKFVSLVVWVIVYAHITNFYLKLDEFWREE